MNNKIKQKQTKKVLLERQQFLESLINLCQDIIYTYDIVEKKNIYSNDGIQTMLGYSVKEIQKMGNQVVSILMHPEDLKNYFEEIYPKYSKVKDNEPVIHQYRMKHKNGEWYWLDCRETIYSREPDGTPRQIFGVAHNITEQKNTEEKLKWLNDLIKYVISHTRSCIAVHDKDLNYVYVSERYLKEYKVKEKNIIGRHHYEIFPDLPQKWRDVHQKALRGEVSSADEDPYYREDGTVDWTSWECRPWYNSDGSIGGLIVYTEVINERMRAAN